jgi:hypothetical protein
MKNRFLLLLALTLGSAVATPAWAICDVTLTEMLPNNVAVLKADCSSGLSTPPVISSISWFKDGNKIAGGEVILSAPLVPTTADVFFTPLLTDGTHSYTAYANTGALPAGKATIVTLIQPVLTVAVSPGGSVSGDLSGASTAINTCTSTGGSACTATFSSGDTVVLTASASLTSANTFAGWGGDCSGAGTTCVVSMTGLRTVTATFK